MLDPLANPYSPGAGRTTKAERECLRAMASHGRGSSVVPRTVST